MGVVNGTITLVVLFAFRPLTLLLFLVATAAASVYWVTMVLAPLFPGTAWFDPEFAGASGRPLGLSPQQLLSYLFCGLLVLAIVLALSLG